jgi:uncharacterized protein YqiB (DUF1249 family)
MVATSSSELIAIMTRDVRRQRYQFDLAALQRLAAVNYAALEGLVEGLSEQRPRVIKIGHHLRFAIALVDDAPYTTEIRIQQQALQQQLPGLRETQLDVRLYHDAQLAEVVRSQGVGRLQSRYPQPNPQMHHSDEKRQVNQFLHDWLKAIQQAGYSQES